MIKVLVGLALAGMCGRANGPVVVGWLFILQGRLCALRAVNIVQYGCVLGRKCGYFQGRRGDWWARLNLSDARFVLVNDTHGFVESPVHGEIRRETTDQFASQIQFLRCFFLDLVNGYNAKENFRD